MGNSVIPINNLVVGSTTITKADFVYGSANYTLNGEDSEVNTADKRIKHTRKAQIPQLSAEVYGDFTSLTSSGLAETVVVKRDDTVVDTIQAVVEATYDSNNETSQLNFTCKHK